jgi:site-specific recombinase XerD
MLHVTWDCWIDLYTETWCTGRNLASTTIVAYRGLLRQFESWAERRFSITSPTEVTMRVALEYVTYLRRERGNDDSAVCRAVVVLKNFYAPMVAFGHLEPNENPMARFPAMKKRREKLPTFLTSSELEKLLESPKTDTLLGLRDHAMLRLLYATGIRAGECAGLREEWGDLEARTIKVIGKGGRERAIVLNKRAVIALRQYRAQRGPISPKEVFFRKKDSGPINRKIVYERVKKYAARAGLTKRVSPHTLRHTCATHLAHREKNLVTIQEILGHKLITSTQIYLHTTAEDLREMAARHPMEELSITVASLIEGVRLPIDYPPRRRSEATVGGGEAEGRRRPTTVRGVA